jgi:hypothetical protein
MERKWLTSAGSGNLGLSSLVDRKVIMTNLKVCYITHPPRDIHVECNLFSRACKTCAIFLYMGKKLLQKMPRLTAHNQRRHTKNSRPY